ncbi:MAG: glutathione S-transferase family protein [Pseudomonadota bacterium]
MGMLVDGAWTEQQLIPRTADGAFKRRPSSFRSWITADGSAGPSGDSGFKAESGRYHLYVSYACPWAHRTLILRALKNLTPHISVSVVHADMFDKGWTFDDSIEGATGDTLMGKDFAYEIYQAADPKVTTRVTVPILWDKQRQTIVSNESSEIIRMFNSAFNELTGNTLDFYPSDLRAEIDAINERTYPGLNNGVYRSGFATTQSAYDQAVGEVFDTLDWLEGILSTRRYLAGDRVTEADWRVFPTLARFDQVYVGHFKCARNKLIEFPNLWAYTRELFQWPGVAETVNMEHIRQHYHGSHESINPHRILPIAQQIDWHAPHGRDALSAA